MKTFGADAMAAIVASEAIVGGALEIVADPPVRVWTGEGTITLPTASGSQTFVGIGDRALAQVSMAMVGASAQGLTLSLSGVDPEAIPLVDAEDLRGAPVAVWRLVFDASGTRMLGWHVFTRGRVDDVATEETLGGQAVISVAIEGAARGLGQRGGRMRTDADQRLVKAGDGSFRRIAYAGEVALYWGGEKPVSAAQAIPNSVPAGGGLIRPNASDRLL